jgi:hypothetical protein
VPELAPLELKAYLPAKDFELSKRFYEDTGFTVCPSSHEPAILHYGPCGGEHVNVCFLLQNHYVKEFAEHLQMHLLVEDVDAWWELIQAKQISQKYGVEALPPQLQLREVGTTHERAW